MAEQLLGRAGRRAGVPEMGNLVLALGLALRIC
jgi:hypothetical protein